MARPNPYAYTVIPPIGRLLDAIRAHCGVGGTIRPGNRTLAEWANYASAGHIAPLLDQLACDGRILYDRDTGLITLLSDPDAGSGDPVVDQSIPAGIDSAIDPESAPIPSRDRVFALSDAEYESIPRRDQLAPRMEDHVLVAAAENQDSAAARYTLPCSDELIPSRDHPAALMLAELGADEAIIADALTARPDLAVSQVRATYAHFEPRIKAGRCTIGAFFKAIRRGQLHTAPPDPEKPIDPAAYSGQPGYELGSDADNASSESLRDHALRITPAAISGRDFQFVLALLGGGATDEAALSELARRRPMVRR